MIELTEDKVLYRHRGSIRGHYAHLARLTVGEVHLAAGTVVPLHDHPHEQVTYVIAIVILAVVKPF